MKIGRRLLCLALALLIVVSALPLSALAASSQEEAVQAVYEAINGALDTVNTTLTGYAELSCVAKGDPSILFCSMDSTKQVTDLLSKGFLSELFAYQQIQTMTLKEVEWSKLDTYLLSPQGPYVNLLFGGSGGLIQLDDPDDPTGESKLSVLDFLKKYDSVVPIVRTEDGAPDDSAQMYLMMGVLASVLARYDTKAGEFDSQGTSTTLDYLNTIWVPVTLDGDGFSAPVAIYFFNNNAEHNVTFKGEGVTGGEATSHTCGESLNAPPASKDGYLLTGWKKTYINVDDTANIKVDAATEGKIEAGTVAADLAGETMGPFDVEYEAIWAQDTVQVKYHYENGTETVDEKTQAVGESWSTPSDPTREGYTFDGWYTASGNGGDKVEGTYTDKGVTDVYAHWKKNAVVTFMDGSENKGAVTADSTGKVTPIDEPTKTGYTFAGWYDSNEGGSPVDFNSKTFEFESTTNVYAQWTPNTYTVNFAGGEGTVEGSMEPQEFTYDEEKTPLTQNGFTRKGYEFSGWSGSDGKSYTNGQEVQNLTSDPEGTITMTAKWAPKTYQVTLDANGGKVNGEDKTTITVTYDQTYGNDLPDPEREGYTFANWQTGDGKVVNKETKVGDVLDVTTEGPHTLTAQWNAKGDTPYKVQHWQQNVGDDGYTLVENDTQNEKGLTDSEVSLTPKTYTGFHVNTDKSNSLKGTVGADGKTVMDIYYDRDTFEVTWQVGDTTAKETYRYGAELSHSTEREDTDHVHYTFDKWEPTLEETVTKAATYTAKYTESHEARIGETNWRTLELALEHAAEGDTVVLEADAELTGEVTVPEGVMLLLPVSADDTGYDKTTGFNPDGKTYSQNTGKDPKAALFHKLTIPAGSTLTVNGTVLVNAVTGRPNAGHYDMDVTGGYGEIALAGNITVGAGGILDVCGYVTGEGIITAEPGGEVRDLYIVRNWRGGSQAYDIFPSVYPMNQVDMHNIEVKTVIEAGAKLVGTVKMYASNSYYYTRFPQIDPENGLIRQSEGTIEKTYDKATGREKLVMNGTGSIEASELPIVGITLTTGAFVYPIDGDMDFELSGDWTVNERLKLMPGVLVTLADGSLTFAETTNKRGASMLTAIYDSFQPRDTFGNGTNYPDDRGEASLTLGGGTTTVVKSDFGGKILVTATATEENPARISFAPGIATTVTTEEADGTAAASSPLRTLTFSATVGGTAVKPGMNYVCYVKDGETVVTPSNEMPAVTIDYAAEALTGFAEGHSYTINGAPAQVSDGKLGLEPEWLGTELKIADVTGEDEFLYSAAQTLAVPARPDAPSGLYGVTPSSPEADNGSIAGLDSTKTYEYKPTDGDEWTAVDEGSTSISGLTVGTYQVRTGATASAFVSEPAEVEVVYVQPATPGDTTVGHTNPDGSSTSTTTRPDGTQVVTDTATDGTVTETTTKPDGTVTEKVTAPDNTVTEKVTQTDGSATERTTTPDGVVGQKSTDAEGKVTSAEVVIPKEAEKQDVVTAPVEVPAAKTVEEAPEISVRTESTESKKVEIPVTEFGPGTVAIIVHEDGTEEVVRDCTIGENGVVLNVEGDVTLKIVDNTETFEDVEDANHWASNAVEFVAARELFNGTGENKFTPNGSMTRGMMVTVLYRLAYEPDAVEEGFADVKSDAYYSDAVAWAAENGVVNGYADNTFAPDDNVSREQLVTILHRYAQKKGYATEKRGTLANFADASSVSSWASDAMSWAVELGLVNGTDASHISPAKSATRAEVATILMRFCEKVVK